eukprot:scaffold4843_cov18-Tisochrysis_lutea.AAC.1
MEGSRVGALKVALIPAAGRRDVPSEGVTNRKSEGTKIVAYTCWEGMGIKKQTCPFEAALLPPHGNTKGSELSCRHSMQSHRCDCMAFVMGSSSGSPGGGTLMLQLVNHLRRQGFFVAVALTRPFGFEGNRKMEQADALVEAMEEVSNLVVSQDPTDHALVVEAMEGVFNLVVSGTIRVGFYLVNGLDFACGRCTGGGNRWSKPFTSQNALVAAAGFVESLDMLAADALMEAMEESALAWWIVWNVHAVKELASTSDLQLGSAYVRVCVCVVCVCGDYMATEKGLIKWILWRSDYVVAKGTKSSGCYG